MSSFQGIAEEHYKRLDVQREILDFCRDRWVAVHCTDAGGNLIFRRYFKGKPITLEALKDFSILFKGLGNVRSIYATANKYHKIKSREDVYALSNVHLCTPTWDVDGEFSNWRETIAVTRQLISIIEKEGVQKSVYAKWSGNGCHIHISEEAFSENSLCKAHPLDLAYATVEYVKLKFTSEKSDTLKMENTVIENRMDPGRVFTVPLSLHRTLNAVCICMKPNELDSFSPEWTQPSRFKHNPNWREAEKGEADELALKAYQNIGGYPLKRPINRRKAKRLDQQISEWLKKE